MMLTNLGIIDNRWYHDPLFVSDNYNTVALKLLKQKIFPPQQWIHDFNEYNIKNESIKSFLVKYNVLIQSDQKIQCYCGHQSNIYLSHYDHQICLQCLQNSCLNQNQQNCPICHRNLYIYIKSQFEEYIQQNNQDQDESLISYYSIDDQQSESNDKQSLNSSYLSKEQRSQLGIDNESDDRENDFNDE